MHLEQLRWFGAASGIPLQSKSLVGGLIWLFADGGQETAESYTVSSPL
jgi:hypothetical protein